MTTHKPRAGTDFRPVAISGRARLGLFGSGVFLAGVLAGALVAWRLRRESVRTMAPAGEARPPERSVPEDGGRPPVDPSGRYYSSAADPAGGSVAGTVFDGSGEPRPVAVGAGADEVPVVSAATHRASLNGSRRGGTASR
ncbi:hypothetical protein [Pseudofrankia sp. EUN1h]|uniref:hypothetical protein n=2 Tax=Pseudofrankia TaxID=2994363 RepID=UPI000234BD1C|nr:hypothetical protein [Pseudofrankia sp. EUN1h]OHV31359.1 hypothetical protein BCD49_32060 [Pseudofrankia sp. EUN1h]